MKKCPYCGKDLQDPAVRCLYCKKSIGHVGEGEIRAAGRKKIRNIILAILAIAVSIAVIYAKANPSGRYYINSTYKIKVWYPRGWDVIDLNRYYYIYKGLSSAITPEDSDIRLICAFSCSKDFQELDPLITLIVQPVSAELRNLPAEDLRIFIDRGVLSAPADNGRGGKELPSIITIKRKRFVSYTASTIADGVKWKNIYLYFVEGEKLYTICLSSRIDAIDSYKPALDDIAGSIKILT